MVSPGAIAFGYDVHSYVRMGRPRHPARLPPSPTEATRVAPNSRLHADFVFTEELGRARWLWLVTRARRRALAEIAFVDDLAHLQRG